MFLEEKDIPQYIKAALLSIYGWLLKAVDVVKTASAFIGRPVVKLAQSLRACSCRLTRMQRNNLEQSQDNISQNDSVQSEDSSSQSEDDISSMIDYYEVYFLFDIRRFYEYTPI
jgi:hypothetical protein